MSADEKRRKHHRLPDDVPRKLNGRLKIDATFEEAARGILSFSPPRDVTSAAYGVVRWANDPADADNLICPYCSTSVAKYSLHDCPDTGRLFVVPQSARTLARASRR
jgi:hypothetical protein